MIRVLIVEDSVTQREIICRMVRENTEMTVVGEAKNGEEGVEKARELVPDVVLMDVHMGAMNGIEATRNIMRHQPTPIVIMSSTLQERDIDLAVEAMRVGAVMAIEKPKGAALLHMSKMAPRLHQVLLEAAGTKLRNPTGRLEAIPKRPADPQHGIASYQLPTQQINVIGVVASAGGPSVLVEIFSALPPDFPIPILLVQHISAGFEKGFANWLTQRTGQVTQIASEGQKLSPGVWLGPTNFHLVLKTRQQVGLMPRQPVDIHCPAGNPLLASLAEHYRTAAVGVVLTGMGDDGAIGLKAMRDAGGHTLIQDEATAMVWGMPRAAKAAEASQFELCPTEIARALARIARQSSK